MSPLFRLLIVAVTSSVLVCAADCVPAVTITVDAGQPVAPIQREVYGNNIGWCNFNHYYTNSDSLPAHLLRELRNLGMGSLRYPGGCLADTFKWEETIGPKHLRPVQYGNGCGAPAIPFYPAAFGVDEFLRLCEQLGVEPQITLEFRAPDVTVRFQAETSYSVVHDPQGQVQVMDFNLDDGQHVSFPNVGNQIKLSFFVPRDGYYRLNLRNRSGDKNDNQIYWKLNAYSYSLNGSPLSFTPDATTISGVDIDGWTTWGTTRSDVVFLRWGTNELTITANQSWLKVDYLDLQELNHDNSVKRALAWVAYCNGDPSDTRVIGVDQAGVDWKTVGYWAAKRVENGRAEPYAVKFWEVGNEAWGPDPYGSPPNQNPYIYNDGWLSYYNAIRAFDPSLRLSLCGFIIMYSNWTNALVSVHGSRANFIHYHPYFPLVSSSDPEILFKAGQVAYLGTQATIDQYRHCIGTYHPSRVDKIRLAASEWSACYGWTGPNVDWAVRMSGVLSVADQLGTMTKNGDIIEAAQYWLLYAANYCVFEEGQGPNAPNGYFRHGIYDALALFGNYFGDQSLSVEVSADCPTFNWPGWGGQLPAGNYPMLTAYASQDSSNYYLVVINKDPVNSIQADVVWNGASDAASRMTIRTISSTAPLPNYTTKNSAQSQVIRTVTSTASYSSVRSHVFPACSVTGFVVEKAKPENLKWFREAEDIFTVNADRGAQGNIVVVGPWTYDSKGHVIIRDVGDTIVIPFSIRKRGCYTIRLRNRSGQQTMPTYLWDNGGYNYWLNGEPVQMVPLAGSVSPRDRDGSTFWGTVELRGQILDVGRHYLKIAAGLPLARVDWIEVEEDRVYSYEAENVYSVVTQASGQAGESDLGLDSISHVTVANDDCVEFTVSVSRPTIFDPQVRVRSGDTSSSTSYVSRYSWSINGRPVGAILDSVTVSPLDSDGATRWGTIRLSRQFLTAGEHKIRVEYAGAGVGRVDYLALLVSTLGVQITNPTSEGFYLTDNPVLNLGAVSTDDIIRVQWTNSRGGSGECSGPGLWTAAVPLQPGDNTVTVRAFDSRNLSTTGVITVRRLDTQQPLSEIKGFPDGTPVELGSKIVSAVFEDSIYIQDPDRSSGIRVVAGQLPAGLQVGHRVCVSGVIHKANSERYIVGSVFLQP